MQISDIYNTISSLSSISSHKSVVLDVPLTFNQAIKPASDKTVKLFTKRTHSATVGQEAKVNASSILKTNRRRGDSEPIRLVPEKKKATIEPPKPIEDRK